MRESELVALKDLAPPGYLVLHQSQIEGAIAILIHESFSFRSLPMLKISNIDCMSFRGDAEKCLTVCLVCHSLSTPADSILVGNGSRLGLGIPKTTGTYHQDFWKTCLMYHPTQIFFLGLSL